MDNRERQLFSQIFEAYNLVYAQAWDRLLASAPPDKAPDRERLAGMENEVENDVQGWHLAVPAGGGRTAGEILDAVDDADAAVELAGLAAVVCDGGLPDLVKIKLGSFGLPVFRLILDAALDSDWESQTGHAPGEPLESGLVRSSVFLRLLGEWGYQEGLPEVLDRFLQLDLPSELIAEAVRTYAADLGEAAVRDLILRLRGSLGARGDLGPAQEYLLIALTDIGKQHPSEDIFRCLRDCFRKMSCKAIGAICLGDYGDGRAIPALRGFLEKNPRLADRQVLAEALSAIRRLGGDLGGLPRPDLVRPAAERPFMRYNDKDPIDQAGNPQ